MISARPPESWSSVANCSQTRTGSSELSTVTALVRRICSVASAAAASTTDGAEPTKSVRWCSPTAKRSRPTWTRSEEHTSELQSRGHLVCRLLLEKKKQKEITNVEQ